MVTGVFDILRCVLFDVIYTAYLKKYSQVLGCREAF